MIGLRSDGVQAPPFPVMWLPTCGRRKRREESSCDLEDFVANKMEAHTLRPRPIEEEGRSCLQHVPAQLVPCVPFGEDAFGEAVGAVSAVGLLYDFEDQFSHTSMMWEVSIPVG